MAWAKIRRLSSVRHTPSSGGRSGYGAGVPNTSSSVMSAKLQPANAPFGQSVAKFGTWLLSMVNLT